MNQETIKGIIFKTITETNLELPSDKQLELSLGTGLFGIHGKLDSLDLVNLIVKAEQVIQDELGISLTLADETALSQEESPFQTIGSLVTFILDRVTKQA